MSLRPLAEVLAPGRPADPAGWLADAVAVARRGEDPYPFLREVVARADAVRGAGDVVYVVGYSTASELLRSGRLCKQGEHGSTAFAPPAERSGHNATPGWLTTIDDPDHDRIRCHVVRPFTSRAVEAVRVPTRELLDELPAGLDTRKPVDLLAAVGFRLPSLVLDRMIGIPLGAHPDFPELAHEHQRDREPTADKADRTAAAAAREVVFSLIRGMLARRSPDGVADGLMAAVAAKSLSAEELVSLLGQMYLAGFHAAAYLLGNATHALLTRPAQAEALRADPGLAAAAVTETLRHDTPVMTATYRAAEALDVAGLQVPAGHPVSFLLGAANRDPRVFDRPERFDLHRAQPAPVLSFSTGSHFCLAACLVQVQIEVVLGELFTRFPRMCLAQAPLRSRTFHLRGFTALPVILDHGPPPTTSRKDS